MLCNLCNSALHCILKEKQFHTWSKEATERLSRSADNTIPSTHFTNPCENTTSEIQINTTITQFDQGKELDASIRRSLALVNIAEIYQPETWTRVYTDGSATKATTDGGADIIIQYPSGAT